MSSPDHDPPLETREVTVDEPQLSAELNHALSDEVRDAVGRRSVEVPADRPSVSHGDSPSSASPFAVRSDRFLLVMLVAASIVIGAIIALLINRWWVLAPVVIVLWLVTYAVVVTVRRMTSLAEKPAPETVAAMEEEGIKHPERLFDSIVREFTPQHSENDGHRNVAAEDDPARAAAEHRDAETPSGGPSRSVGP